MKIENLLGAKLLTFREKITKIQLQFVYRELDTRLIFAQIFKNFLKIFSELFYAILQ